MVYRTTPRMKARKAARRQAFLTAATRLFGQHGFHATTVPRIVAASGSSTGSFYFYFDNKEDVFGAVLRGAGDRLAEALNRAIEQGGDPAGRMRAAVETTFLYLAGNPIDARLLITESSGLSVALESVRRDIQDSHARSLEQALTPLLGEDPSTDPAVIARCWLGSVFESVRWWLRQDASDRLPAVSIGKQVADFNLRGIKRA